MIRVIIADDEENVCQLIRGLIDWDALGMEIAGVAHNGVEALDMVRTLEPDLMITDIRMPGYDGLELIRRAKNQKEDLDFIIISGYRHFEYAQNAIQYGVGDYLLKPIKKEDFLAALHKMRNRYIQRTDRMNQEEQLKKQLQNDAEKLRAGLFTECLLKKGGSTGDLTVEKANAAYCYHFAPGLFQVCAVKIDCGYEDQYNNAVPILEEKVVQILQSLLKECCFDLNIRPEDSTAWFVLNYGAEKKKAVRHQLKAVLDELMLQKDVFGRYEFTVSAGSVQEEISGLKESFRTARFGLGQRLVRGTGRLMEETETPEDSGAVADALLAEMNRTMGAALEVLDRGAACACILALKEQVLAEPRLSGEEILSLAAQVCSMYLTHLRNNQIPVHYGEEFLEKFRIHANRCSSVEDVFRYLSIMVGESLDVIAEDKKQADTRPVRLAKQFIRENYSRPISLEEVSAVAGFNPTYFSTLFKKESGSNFVDYLSEIRMNRAKELLRETNLNIAVICEQVGYSDLKHFTKSFKKSTGIKPNEYRKLYS